MLQQYGTGKYQLIIDAVEYQALLKKKRRNKLHPYFKKKLRSHYFHFRDVENFKDKYNAMTTATSYSGTRTTIKFLKNCKNSKLIPCTSTSGFLGSDLLLTISRISSMACEA